jgi:hypothetical protein
VGKKKGRPAVCSTVWAKEGRKVEQAALGCWAARAGGPCWRLAAKKKRGGKEKWPGGGETGRKRAGLKRKERGFGERV